MRKLFLILAALPCFAQAGTITTAFSPLGTITFSTGPLPTGIFVDSQTAFGGFSGVSPIIWNLTIGSGVNRFLTVSCGTQGASSQVTGVTVGGFTMTLSTSIFDATGGTNRAVQMFTYINPPSGSQSIVASFGGGDSAGVECNALSFTGVNQSTPIDVSTANFHQPGGGSQAASLTTTIANDLILDVQCSDQDSSPIVVAGGQTQQFQLKSAGGGNVTGSSSKPAPTATSYTMTWTSIDTGIQAAIAIRPAP